QARSLGGGALARMLDTGSEPLAVRAALALGRTKQAAAASVLLGHVRDRRPAVRAMALYALGLLADGQGVVAMLHGMRDRNSAVRVGALDALDRETVAGQLSPAQLPRVAAAEIHAALHDRNPILRRIAAIDLVAFHKTAQAGVALATLDRVFGRDAAIAVRRAAMWALFRGYATKVPRTLLLAALANHDSVVRIEAVRAVGLSHDPAMISALEPLLGDRSWRVQEQAAESIRALRNQSPTIHWKAIPPGIHLPNVGHNPLDALPSLPRPPQPLRAAVPDPSHALAAPLLDPTDAALMVGPAPGMHPRVRIVTTKGNIYLMLFPEWAPLTVENFLNVAARGYYDNQPWFRIVPDFVVQTGDPSANAPGLGYTIGAEENPMMQGSGVLSMGLDYPNGKAARDSAGTEYYITLSPQYHLDRDFTVFGRVIGGAAVLAHLVESDRVLRIDRIPDVMVSAATADFIKPRTSIS
ncbi:MAG TPA: peptidylprolyl isomerase, partial [Candidatus Dormibacteraeota bacterium]|nr:peptidylprolyl isomerase [Candidatus Dormibacteraeota bacterium]